MAKIKIKVKCDVIKEVEFKTVEELDVFMENAVASIYVNPTEEIINREDWGGDFLFSCSSEQRALLIPKYEIFFFVETYSDKKLIDYFATYEDASIGQLACAHEYGFVVRKENGEEVKRFNLFVEADDYKTQLERGL